MTAIPKIIGIRKEVKNIWETRVPLTPMDIRRLVRDEGVRIHIQPSLNRVFKNEEYSQSGAQVKEDLSEAEVIFGVKEIPEEAFSKGKTYVFFSHTIKGQVYNLKMLKRLMELKCNLIDYEKIADEKNTRLIFFGRHAGLAGMIETLYAFGRKAGLQGLCTPFQEIKQAYLYDTLEDAKAEIKSVGSRISENGLPQGLGPVVIGFCGYGNVSRGAQEIFDLLPHRVVFPKDLEKAVKQHAGDNRTLLKVVFREEDMVQPLNGTFNLQDYYSHPHTYESIFESHLPYLKILVNCIYWSDKYPRLVTKDYLRREYSRTKKSSLQVIGDISCDIDGSIEINHKSTMPDQPCYTYHADSEKCADAIEADGITVMAIDNLPCEFSREASMDFSLALKPFIHAIATADFNRDFDSLALPAPIKNALILHKGAFTPDFDYMQQYLKESP